MSSNEVKVKVSHMTKKFGDLLVLNDISFEVKKGEFLCVVGPTGCGKTTFLNCLTKLGVYQLTSGEILINNEPVDLQKHNVAYIFQEYSAFPWQTVEENVAYGLKIKKRPAAEIKQRVDEMLKEGLVQEVQKLKEMGCRKNMVSMQGLGYKEILNYLDGTWSLEEAVYILKRDTRHFAKRQITWFKRERQVEWFYKPDYGYDEEAILEDMLGSLWEKGIIG